MRCFTILTVLAVALYTIAAPVTASSPFACDQVCSYSAVVCTTACQKESLPAVCSKACQDGYQSCLMTCTIGHGQSSSSKQAVTPSSSSIRHRIHSAKQKKHTNSQHYAPPNDPCHRLNPWFCASCQMGGGQCHFLNATCQVCVPTTSPPESNGSVEMPAAETLVEPPSVETTSSSSSSSLHARSWICAECQAAGGICVYPHCTLPPANETASTSADKSASIQTPPATAPTTLAVKPHTSRVPKQKRNNGQRVGCLCPNGIDSSWWCCGDSRSPPNRRHKQPIRVQPNRHNV